MGAILCWLSLVHGLSELPPEPLCEALCRKAVVRHEEALRKLRAAGSWQARQEAEAAERSWLTLVALWNATHRDYDLATRINWMLRWRAMTD